MDVGARSINLGPLGYIGLKEGGFLDRLVNGEKVEDAWKGSEETRKNPILDGIFEAVGPGLVRVGIGALGVLLIIVAAYMLANPGSKVVNAVSNLAKAA